MFDSSFLRRYIGGALIAVLLSVQFGCSVDRLRKPIEDFDAATSVVTAQARLAYSEINRVERIRAIQKARRLGERIDPRELIAKTTFLEGPNLAARFDALNHLEGYASLLSQIVNSDAPDKIAASATNLEVSLNALADRISSLSNAPASVGPSPSEVGSGSSAAPNNEKFKTAFGVFATITREVLTLIARKKQNDALRKSIEVGEAPINDLIEAIKLDLRLIYALKRNDIEKDMIEISRAYNSEITKPEPDDKRLDDIARALISNFDAQEAFHSTDPTDALDKMKNAHSKMVSYARQKTEASLNDAVSAIQSFVESATRLGSAVIKLRSFSEDKS